MAQKNFVVRAGFVLTQRIVGERGEVKFKEYGEGDIVKLDPESDVIPHQVELADEKDRIAAAKAEAEVRKAADAARAPASGGIDQDALASAIASGVAQALAAMQKAAPVA